MRIIRLLSTSALACLLASTAALADTVTFKFNSPVKFNGEFYNIGFRSFSPGPYGCHDGKSPGTIDCTTDRYGVIHEGGNIVTINRLGIDDASIGILEIENPADAGTNFSVSTLHLPGYDASFSLSTTDWSVYNHKQVVIGNVIPR